MNEAQKQATLSAIRSALISIGSILSANGYVTDQTVQLVVGLLMTVGPILWGIAAGFLKEKSTETREVVALNAGIAVANASTVNVPPVHPIDAQAVIAEFSPTKERK